MTSARAHPAPKTGALSDQHLIGELVVATFGLNGRFLAVAEALARPVGLTAAWWQVLGPVAQRARTVADVARTVGLTRQSVQRIADLLVERGWADFIDNPAHRRARLLSATEDGRAAVRRLSGQHAAWTERVAAQISRTELERTYHVLLRLSAAVDADPLVTSRRRSRTVPVD